MTIRFELGTEVAHDCAVRGVVHDSDATADVEITTSEGNILVLTMRGPEAIFGLADKIAHAGDDVVSELRARGSG